MTDIEEECGEEYIFPSKITIQCQRRKGHSGKHDAKWKGKDGIYETWW